MTVRCAYCSMKNCSDCIDDASKPYRPERPLEKPKLDPRPTPEENFRQPTMERKARISAQGSVMTIIYERGPLGWSWSVLGWPKRTHGETLERAITDSAQWVELILGTVKRARVAQWDGYFVFTRTQSGWMSCLTAAREATALGRAVVDVFGEPASMTIAMEGDSNGPK